MISTSSRRQFVSFAAVAVAAPTTPDDFRDQIASEISAWRDVIRRAGIRI